MLRKCQPGPRVMFSISMPRSDDERRRCSDSGRPARRRRRRSPRRAPIECARSAAELAHDAEQIARKPVAHVSGGARGAIQIRVQAVAALFFEDQRKNLLLEIARLVQMPLRVVFGQARVLGLPGRRAASCSEFPLRACRTRRIRRSAAPECSAARAPDARSVRRSGRARRDCRRRGWADRWCRRD